MIAMKRNNASGRPFRHPFIGRNNQMEAKTTITSLPSLLKISGYSGNRSVTTSLTAKVQYPCKVWTRKAQLAISKSVTYFFELRLL